MSELLLKALKKYTIDSLIHVGGHRGQEVDFYKSLNLDKVIYFEPVESFAVDIEKKIESLDNFELYKLALGSEDSEVIFLLPIKVRMMIRVAPNTST